MNLAHTFSLGFHETLTYRLITNFSHVVSPEFGGQDFQRPQNS